MEEFKKALLVKAGLIFEDSMLRQVMDRFDDDGSGEVPRILIGEFSN